MNPTGEGARKISEELKGIQASLDSLNRTLRVVVLAKVTELVRCGVLSEEQGAEILSALEIR